MRAINQTQSSYASSYATLPGMYVFDQRGQISATFVTLGCGAVTGLVLFILIAIFSRETVEDLYHDRAYWIIDDDGISDHVQSEASLEVSQGGSIKGEHAYL